MNRAERLLSEEPECPEHGHPLTLKCFQAFHASSYQASLDYAAKLLELGTRFGDRDLQAFGLMFQGRVLVAQGKVDEGLALLDEATVEAVSGELGHQTTGFIYCMAITATSSLSGEILMSKSVVDGIAAVAAGKDPDRDLEGCRQAGRYSLAGLEQLSWAGSSLGPTHPELGPEPRHCRPGRRRRGSKIGGGRIG